MIFRIHTNVQKDNLAFNNFTNVENGTMLKHLETTLMSLREKIMLMLFKENQVNAV